MPFHKIKLDNILERFKRYGKNSKNTTPELELGTGSIEVPLDDVVDSGNSRGRTGDDPRERWFAAVASGDVDTVKDMLRDAHVHVDARDDNNWSALHLCAWNGYPSVCQELLKARCDVNRPGPGRTTALALACQKGHLNVVNLLIQAHCDVDQTAAIGVNEGVSALHFAAQHGHVDIVKRLISSGAEVNITMTARGIKGVTPLHLAVEAGHMDVMDVLINAGCDVQSSTKGTSETLC